MTLQGDLDVNVININNMEPIGKSQAYSILAEKLAEASRIIGENPVTLQLRYLQTLSEITSKDNNKSTIIPIPIDLIKSVLGK